MLRVIFVVRVHRGELDGLCCSNKKSDQKLGLFVLLKDKQHLSALRNFSSGFYEVVEMKRS